MLTNKAFFWSQFSLLMVLGASFAFPSLADNGTPSGATDVVENTPSDEVYDVPYGLEKTLEYNFSPEDRARLRKALTDFARNNDPEHIKIKRQRQAMRDSLKERFAQCNIDLDDSLDRQEVTQCLPQIARHFSAVDVDQDSVITFDELELAQAKWRERHRSADAKIEAKRIKEAEAQIIQKASQLHDTKQASTTGNNPS